MMLCISNGYEISGRHSNELVCGPHRLVPVVAIWFLKNFLFSGSCYWEVRVSRGSARTYDIFQRQASQV